MSIHISRRLSHALPIATAALFIHIGSATAATPQRGIQQHMRDVLSGSIATHPIPHSESDPSSAVRPNVDMEESVRRLLSGWDAFDVAPAKTKPARQAQAVDSSQEPQTDEDFQARVRDVLLGESAWPRGAL